VFGIEIQEPATACGVGLNSHHFTAYGVGEGNETVGNYNVVLIADNY
jgi:hypothetical protein